MAFEQDPNRLPAHARNQFSLDRFLGHQAHRPACSPLRWLAANHGDNPLLVGSLQQFRVPLALSLEQRPLQAVLPISFGDRPDRLRGEWYSPGCFRRTDARIQLQQRQRPQDHPHLLNTPAQHLLQFFLVLDLQVERIGWARHTQVYAKTFLIINVC